MVFSVMRNQKLMPAMEHLLIISIAINAWLVLRLKHDGHEWARGPGQAPNGKNVVRVIKNVSHEAKPANDHEYLYLDRGDPTMYEIYWKQMGDETTVVLPGWQSISYFSDTKNYCWFLEPGFANAVTRLHNLVGNAQTRNYHIVVGTGSTQLFQAALYALCPSNAPEPMSIISAAPFYSCYPQIVDCLKSGLYKWKGDASKFNKDEPYIELVTSPNNPDGSIRQAVVNGSGVLVHDLAYYWPQYTPISVMADHDIMLFTVSKSTGHAGIRLGWALVKDKEVAKKMTKFIEISSIGVSKDSQLRAAKILDVIADTYEHTEKYEKATPFFHYFNNEMAKRWRQLRSAVNKGQTFSLPDFPVEKCNFSGQKFGTQPGFAWLKCEKAVDDCESFLSEHKILTRGGTHFGSSKKYARISLISDKEEYDEFIQRLSLISSMDTS